jgi:hypothetical protein
MLGVEVTWLETGWEGDHCSGCLKIRRLHPAHTILAGNVSLANQSTTLELTTSTYLHVVDE